MSGSRPWPSLFPYTTLFRSVRALIDGRVIEVPVHEGDTVIAGQLLARIDTAEVDAAIARADAEDRKSTRLNSSHGYSSYAVFCLKKTRRRCRDESVPPGRAG